MEIFQAWVWVQYSWWILCVFLEWHTSLFFLYPSPGKVFSPGKACFRYRQEEAQDGWWGSTEKATIQHTTLSRLYAVTNLGAQRWCCGESGEEKWEYPYFNSKLWVMVCLPKCARDWERWVYPSKSPNNFLTPSGAVLNDGKYLTALSLSSSSLGTTGKR